MAMETGEMVEKASNGGGGLGVEMEVDGVLEKAKSKGGGEKAVMVKEGSEGELT